MAVDVAYGKAIWSGLSWAVGGIPAGRLKPGKPVALRAMSSEQVSLKMEMEAWLIE